MLFAAVTRQLCYCTIQKAYVSSLECLLYTFSLLSRQREPGSYSPSHGGFERVESNRLELDSLLLKRACIL